VAFCLAPEALLVECSKSVRMMLKILKMLELLSGHYTESKLYVVFLLSRKV